MEGCLFLPPLLRPVCYCYNMPEGKMRRERGVVLISPVIYHAASVASSLPFLILPEEVFSPLSTILYHTTTTTTTKGPKKLLLKRGGRGTSARVCPKAEGGRGRRRIGEKNVQSFPSSLPPCWQYRGLTNKVVWEPTCEPILETSEDIYFKKT